MPENKKYTHCLLHVAFIHVFSLELHQISYDIKERVRSSQEKNKKHAFECLEKETVAASSIKLILLSNILPKVSCLLLKNTEKTLCNQALAVPLF